MAEQICDNCGLVNAETARFCQHCAAPLLFKHSTGELPEQTLLGNRYQLEARIGQGGMGAVYRAADTRFNNRSVAIKEMSRAGLTPNRIQEAEDAFERESRLLADLVHPNLPRIYDYFTEEERSYLVMDFIEGETLEDYLEHKGGGPVTLEQALDWGMQLCDVLSHLHTHQPPIIFRDLKPSNVMISNSHIYLIDFGIARIFKPGQSHDTVAFGSPGFAAPEQYGKAQSTPRSDIYSLGALLHCLLTGVDPSEQPFFFRPASELNPVVPAQLDALLLRMLDLKVENRPASAQEVAKTLRSIEDQRISGTLTRATVPRSTTTKQHTVTVPSYSPYTLNSTPARQVNQVRDARGWQVIGTTHGLNARHQEALTSFERALQMDAKLVAAWNGKGTALNMMRRNKEALAAFEQALSLEADNALAWNGKGAAQNALGSPEQALFSFDTALHYEPRLAQALNNKGLVLRQLKRFPEALRAFEQAIIYEPHNALSWNGKGNILYDLGRFQDALSAYQEAQKLNANYAPTYYGIGNVYYAQQRLKSALENYDKAVQLDRNFVKAHDKRGNVLADLKRLNEAISSYKQALLIDPRYAPALNGKANVLCELGLYDEALKDYDAAVRFNPHAPLSWNGLGNVQYHLHNYQKSLEAYDRALKLNPRMASAWHNKSLVLKQLKRNEDALAAAEEAVKLAPNDPDNWRRKAEALRKLTRRKAAREAEAEVARLTGGA
ncbi:MAG: hypothetical protein NVS4B11_08970 [Ktedonobacteraceae bacterium]